jgi:hypothetical protein
VADGRRRAWLAIFAAMALGTGTGASCGDGDDRPDGSTQPRDEEIRATIDGVWGAVGVDPDDVNVAEYAYTFRPDAAACADLPRDDRWFGERGSTAVVTGQDQTQIEDAIVAHLEGEGFEVQRYRSSHPDSPLRAYDATDGEVTVDGTLSPDGYTTVHVRSGPCAPQFGSFDPELYTPDG